MIPTSLALVYDYYLATGPPGVKLSDDSKRGLDLRVVTRNPVAEEGYTVARYHTHTTESAPDYLVVKCVAVETGVSDPKADTDGVRTLKPKEDPEEGNPVEGVAKKIWMDVATGAENTPGG